MASRHSASIDVMPGSVAARVGRANNGAQRRVCPRARAGRPSWHESACSSPTSAGGCSDGSFGSKGAFQGSRWEAVGATVGWRYGPDLLPWILAPRRAVAESPGTSAGARHEAGPNDPNGHIRPHRPRARRCCCARSGSVMRENLRCTTSACPSAPARGPRGLVAS
ncbi:hypothetical protein T492DRAFT_931833 [Pavlovales sp. CCMP2436]|nr:hypothetical protein T492DRAFT_931833 [Pavlovales sp. CCMP2436]